MAKDGTNRGGSRPGAGRKPKAVAEKYANGNPGGRKLTTLDFGCDTSDLQGAEMPPVKEYLKAKQKDGSVTCAFSSRSGNRIAAGFAVAHIASFTVFS